MKITSPTAAELLPQIPGYLLVAEIYAGDRAVVYRAVAQSDNRSVMIKILRSDSPTCDELFQLRHQYTIVKNLNLPGIVRCHSFNTSNNSYALVMEDCGGISLHQYRQQQSLSIGETLNIASQMATILAALARHQIVHQQINPAHLLIQPETGKLELIDFSLASRLPQITPQLGQPYLVSNLAYIAPEQTGRINRKIDYRADFYSLGVTLFELLTNQLPFLADAPSDPIQAQIARSPALVKVLNPKVPDPVAAIVAKLMAKNPEDRYQTALGLQHDLNLCIDRWSATGTIDRFELGLQDLSDRFMLSPHLYGRDREIQTLLAAIDRVADPPTDRGDRGAAELILVTGCAGIGKTALVNELQQPIASQHGYFIAGKFARLDRYHPLSAFVQVGRDLVRQLLLAAKLQQQAWQTQLLAALGDSAQVMIEVIPELEQLIGAQPPVKELSGTAAQERLNRLFQKFIQVFTTPAHPLTIFLDDLHWVDSASIELINLLLTGSGGNLLLIGAYRDDAVTTDHPLPIALTELVNAQAIVQSIALQPLSIECLGRLVADTLTCPTTIVRSLTNLIHQQTHGHPFFATQLLTALHQTGYIWFDRSSGYWLYDSIEIQAATLTDDVVESIAVGLQQLPIATQNILKVAACLGETFALDRLTSVAAQTLGRVAADLWPALLAGSIEPQHQAYKFFEAVDLEPTTDRELAFARSATTYRFCHDLVHQAADSLMPPDSAPIASVKTAYIGALDPDSLPQAQQICARVSQMQQTLAVNAEVAPFNLKPKSDLMAAERCRILGDRQNAIELYDRAIAGAIADADLQQAATSNELAAQFYLDWGKEKIAAVYLQEAYIYFGYCGAIAKTEDLNNRYPHLLAPILPPQPLDSHLTDIVDPFASADLQPQVQPDVNYVDLEAVWQFDRVLANNIPGVIYKFRVDTNEQISFPYISAGCQELFQLSAAEVMADSACLMSLIHPDDFLVLLQIISTSAANLTSKLWEGRFILPSGEVKWIKSASRPESQPDGSIVWDGMLLNISDLKQAELKLAASEQQYYRLIQSIPGVVWEYDLELDKFTFVSDRAETLLGYSVETWLSQSDFWRQHVYAADLERTIQIYDNALRNRQHCEFEYRLVTADNRLIWVYDISTPVFDRQGKLVATAGLFIDITEKQAALQDRQQAEIALQQTNERLASTNQELLRVTQLKDDFLATMSHELRTPLNAILGLSECLQSGIFGSLDERQAKSIATIERSGQHLLSLINDILDVSKIAAGKLELEIVEVSIAHLCKSSLAFVKQQAERQQIQLQLDLEHQLGKIAVDRRRMTQVVINLLANAVKFTPKGGSVTLSAGIATSELNRSTQGDWICLAVTDTGIGISPTDRDRLFQPFIQVDSSLNRQYEGTGLGLALVKQIVELHGGYVTLESELGRGSCFSVYLPYTGTQGDLLTDTHTGEKLQTLTDELEQPIAATILLAEDNKANAITFVSYLNSQGYRTIVANDGIEAIELAKSEHPHLILMDIQMPGMDGIEAIAQIRQQLELAKIPIIALTALALETDLPPGTLSNRDKCLVAGANEYITKPVKLKELNHRIQYYLQF